MVILVTSILYYIILYIIYIYIELCSQWMYIIVYWLVVVMYWSRRWIMIFIFVCHTIEGATFRLDHRWSFRVTKGALLGPQWCGLSQLLTMVSWRGVFHRGRDAWLSWHLSNFPVTNSTLDISESTGAWSVAGSWKPRSVKWNRGRGSWCFLIVVKPVFTMS